MRTSALKWGGLALLAALLAGWTFRDSWLGALGSFLDTGAPPVHADVIVVLAGGWTGERVLLAGELVRAGYAPLAILDSPQGLLYSASECALASAFAVSRGYPAASFECLEMKATSTAEEAVAVAAELRRRGVEKCLVVSVRSHLRRASRIFRRTIPGVELHFTGAENPLYRLERWYETREGRKAIFLEWMKYATEPFGI
jgi:uncharacterized SAM-binding protein YcdF (DUF218 family)